MKKKRQTLRHWIVTYMPLALLDFLIEEKALDKFLDNQISYLETSYNNDEARKDFMVRSYNDAIKSILLKAFLWFDTPEGSVYWTNLHSKAYTSL